MILVRRSVDKLHRAARVLDAPQYLSTISADVTVEADVLQLFRQLGKLTKIIDIGISTNGSLLAKKVENGETVARG